MAAPSDTSLHGWQAGAADAPLKRAPTLYAIIFFKLVKGVLFLFFAVILYFQAAHDLPQEYADLLQKPIFHHLRIHPENKFFQHIAEQIADLTEQRVRVAAIGTAVWSLFPLIEGIGLLFRAPWAGWLAIGESAFFVPIEIYEMARQTSHETQIYMLLITIVNIFIVWYLYANRQRLFHHHH